MDFSFILDGEELDETISTDIRFTENYVISENDSYVIEEGATLQLNPTAYPWNGLKEIVYSLDPYGDSALSAVTVTNDGLVTAVKPGTSVIYVKDISSSQDVYTTVWITVVEAGTSTTMHKVHFDGRGYTTGKSETVQEGKTVAEPEPPTHDGMVFGGWYTDEDCTIPFDFDTPIMEDITLYAKWTSGIIIITSNLVQFYIDSDTPYVSSLVYSGYTIEEPDEPTKEGYIFEGWYTDKECTIPFDFDTPITEDISLYAKWTEEPDKLTNISTVSADEIVLSDKLTVNAAAMGGEHDYTYAVYYKKASDENWICKQAFSDNAEVSIMPAYETTYDICVKVKDGSGTVAKKYFQVNVTAKLENMSEISAEEIIQGGKVAISAAAAGGKPDYTYAVYYKRTADTTWICKQTFTDNADISVKPVYADTYNICVKVKDSRGKVAKKYFVVTVKDKLTNTSEISTEEITKVTVKASATGGTGNYQYAVYYKQVSDENWICRQAFADNAEVTLKPADAANYDICVKVKDGTGTVAKKYFTANIE